MTQEYKNAGHTRMAPIKVILFPANGSNFIDITSMSDNISWSGDEETFSRKLEISLKNSLNRNRAINYSYGDMIYLISGDTELFRGMIYSTSRSQDGSENISSTDNLFYISKGQNTVLYKNIDAGEIVRREVSSAGIPIGDIPTVGYKISRKIFEGVSREEIIKEVLQEVADKTGKKYKLISKNGKAYLIERASIAIETIYLEYLLSGSIEESIEDIVTQVKITKGSLEEGTFVEYNIKDDNNISKYGWVQHVIQASNDEDTASSMKSQMDVYLKENNKPEVTIDIESIGNFSCYTGRKIEVKDNVSNSKNIYYISADTHTVSGGVHKMSLQLSTRLI